MENREIKYALATLVIIFFLMGFVFRKKIKYLSCPLPRYTGKIYKGKSHYLFMFHFVTSFGLSLCCYAALNKNQKLSAIFEDVSVRLLSIFGIWILFFYAIGLLIEFYLHRTDADYRNWRRSAPGDYHQQ